MRIRLKVTAGTHSRLFLKIFIVLFVMHRGAKNVIVFERKAWALRFNLLSLCKGEDRGLGVSVSFLRHVTPKSENRTSRSEPSD